MVVFDELRITNDGEYLVIDARIRKEKIYKDVVITSIKVGTHRNYTEGISSGVVFMPDSDKNEEEHNKSRRVFMRLSSMDLNINLVNSEDEIDLKKDLIYVYIETTPLDNMDNCPSLPCDMMQTLNIGVTMYMSNIYNTFMSYIKELECSNPCTNNVPQGLIDFILRYTTLTTALDSKHFTKANELFERWFSGKHINNTHSSCGCNG